MDGWGASASIGVKAPEQSPLSPHELAICRLAIDEHPGVLTAGDDHSIFHQLGESRQAECVVGDMAVGQNGFGNFGESSRGRVETKH